MSKQAVNVVCLVAVVGPNVEASAAGIFVTTNTRSAATPRSTGDMVGCASWGLCGCGKAPRESTHPFRFLEQSCLGLFGGVSISVSYP